MAKKLKFPLILKDNYQVRTIDELREHFDLERIINYYRNGKLLIWLVDRQYDKESILLKSLTEESSDFISQLYSLLGVTYSEEETVDLQVIAQRQKRIDLLKQYTSDETILKHIEQVAFDQEDLADILDEGYETIYLCKSAFQIPLSQANRTYINIKNATISNFEAIKGAFEQRGIRFLNFSQTKKDYSIVKKQLFELKYIWDNDTKINYDKMLLDPKNMQVPILSTLYDSYKVGNSTEEVALEAARKATLEAYSNWEALFLPTGYSSLYTQHIKSFIENERTKFLSAFNMVINKLYNSLTNTLQNIDEPNIQKELAYIISPLKDANQDLMQIRNEVSTLEKQIYTKLEQLHQQYQSDNAGCEISARVEKGLCLNVKYGKAKNLYYVKSNTGFKRLNTYVNNQINALAAYIDDTLMQEHELITQCMDQRIQNIFSRLNELLS